MNLWQRASEQWAYAHGKPTFEGAIKRNPEDFRVTEVFEHELTGSGEHAWLWVEKSRANSEQVAKLLARHAGVAFKQVGYAGRKDFFAVTQQWFSVWLPGREDPDWEALNDSGLKVLKYTRHQKKLQTGAHSGNQFEITLRDLSDTQAAIQRRVDLIAEQGVPNYFGLQRFGRNFSNLPQEASLAGHRGKKDKRDQQSLRLSAARSWLFNECLSNRVQDGTWNVLLPSEPAMLSGSGAHFNAQQGSHADQVLQRRLKEGDIHPSGPLYGDHDLSDAESDNDLYGREHAVFAEYPSLTEMLKRARLKSQRRATRCMPENMTVEFANGLARLQFALPKGQFATSVLRELLLADGL